MAKRSTKRRGKKDRLASAKYLGVSASTLAHRAYGIPYEVIGGRVWYDVADLDRFIASRRCNPSVRHRAAEDRSAATLLAGPQA